MAFLELFLVKTGISTRLAARFADFSGARDCASPRSPGGLAAPAYRAGVVRGAGGSLQNKRIRESAYNPKRYTKQ